MSYRTVLISLTNVETTSLLVEAAMKISSKERTHLIGLHVIPAVDIPAVLEPIGIPDSVYEDHKAASSQRAAEIRILFDEAVKREGFSGEWVCEKSHTTQITQKVMQHARCADLIIVSQNPKDGQETNHVNLPEHLLMESGRPILVVPEEIEIKTLGDYPMVAWNGSRESTRAVFDAIPILTEAKEVVTLWINPEIYSSDDREMAGTEIATALARYEIPVKILQADTNGRSLGETMCAKLRDTGADMIVMGGYGRSRLREYVFGGATHEILKNMTVPVFISH